MNITSSKVVSKRFAFGDGEGTKIEKMLTFDIFEEYGSGYFFHGVCFYSLPLNLALECCQKSDIGISHLTRAQWDCHCSLNILGSFIQVSSIFSNYL